MWFDQMDLSILAQESTEWYQETIPVLIMLIAAIALSIVVGYTITRRIRMSDYGWKLSLMMGCVLCSSIIIVGNWPPRLGVDLSGGVTFIGQLEVSDDNEQVPVQTLVTQIKSRIDPSGVKEIVVRALGDDYIEIIIPDVSDAEADRIWARAVQTGALQFSIVADGSQKRDENIVEYAVNQLRNIDDPDDPTAGFVYEVARPDKDVEAFWVKLGREKDEAGNETEIYRMNPSLSHVLRDRRSRSLITLPRNFESPEEFSKWAIDAEFGDIEILMLTDDYNVTGEDLSSVRQEIDERARPCVGFAVEAVGRKNMGKLTSNNKGRLLGIVLDDQLLSAPVIQTRIVDQGRITGQFSGEEVQDLIGILKAGKLPAAINKNPISRDGVDSTIGNDLKQKGFWAIGVSFMVVVVFMIGYYRFAGVVACLALLTNFALILAVISLIKQPLTLTGLAGLVLTVGMSVDANVLVFERIREELEKGSTLRMAIRNGFARATVTIVDANITTLITAIVLYAIGTEQIRGFCVALILGIMMSMFTAIFCSRVIFDIAEKQRWLKKLRMIRLVKSTSIDFVGKRRVAAVGSIVLILFGLGAAIGLGDSILGHDLRGGTTARIAFNQEMDRDDILDALQDARKEFEGEPIQWEVTEITSQEFPDGTFFKVDSSLQPYEGGGDTKPEGYPELKDILNEVFAGQIDKYSVEVESLGIVEDTGNAGRRTPSSAVAPTLHAQADIEPTSEPDQELALIDPQQLHWVSIQDDTSNDTGQSGTGDQDTNNQGGGDQSTGDQDTGDQSTGDQDTNNQGGGDQSTGDQDTGDQNTGDQNTGDQSTGDQDTGDQDTGNQDTGNQDTGNQDTGDGTTVDPTGTNANQDDPDSSLLNPQDPINNANNNAVNPTTRGGRQPYKANLTFNHPANAEGMKSLINEIGINLNLGIGEDDVLDIIPSDPDESVDVPSSRGWTITVASPDEASFNQLLTAIEQDYEQTSYFSSLSEVGGQIARESQVQALVAILLSLVGIVAYIWIRFQRVVFGLAAVVALVHDVLIVLGAIAITGYLASLVGVAGFGAVKISLPVVAAFLTIIGYSLNDTIVVFDRIREVRGKNPDLTGEMINRSIGQTLSRTVLTSATTFVVVFILLVGGGEAIQGFAFALTIGVLVGTYSSIFIASPTLLWLLKKKTQTTTTSKKKPGTASA